MSAVVRPFMVPHPDGGSVLLTSSGWRWASSDRLAKPVYLAQAMAWCESEKERDHAVAAHNDLVAELAGFPYVTDGTMRLAELVSELADAATLLDTRRVSERSGLRLRTVRDYLTDGKLQLACRRPGKAHGTTHLWSERQIREWLAGRPERGVA